MPLFYFDRNFCKVEKTQNNSYNIEMKKILYFTITYACIGLFLIFLLSPNNNFWLWLVIGILLLILPIIASKLLKNNYNISKEAIIAVFTLLFSSIFILIFNFQKPQYDLIAVTSDIQKASEIQKLFSIGNQVFSQYIFDEKGTPSRIAILMPKTNKNTYYSEIKFLLKSSIIDDDVFIGLNAKHSDNQKQMINNIEKEIEHFIYSFKGITKANVTINHDDKETKNIKIKVKMNEYINAKETEKLIKLYVKHSLQNIKPEQIQIDILHEN